MNKTAIKNFAVWARKKLIADINYKAGLMGITEDGIKMALPQSTRDMEFYDIGTKEPYVISGEAVHQRKRLAMLINQKAESSDYKTAYRSVVEEVAYTWFNRLIAIRFMEVNDYLPSHIRVLSSESGTKLEPDLVTTPFDADLELSDYEQSEIIRLKNENKVDELFHMLFIKQCNALNEILPKLFEKTSDYTELLLNVSVTDQDSVVYHLVHDIPEDDFNIEKGGQVEIIGWLYQYYNTEPKMNVDAAVKNGNKVSKEYIPAKTQLFTPDWIVRYMVENSLGRLWLEGHPNPDLKASWKYYLDEAEQEADVQAQLEKIREEYRTIKPEDIKVIDPCMGSGHILVYAFEVLMQIYEAEGYTQREAAKSILDNNIYGLDIDDRAFQLAYFAVMMKARQYNRRILSKDTVCHVYSIQESNAVNRNQLKYFGADLNESERNDAMNQITGLLDTFIDAKEYGSILNVNTFNWGLLYYFVAGTNENGQMSLDSIGLENTKEQLLTLIDIAQVMSQRYNIAITNPPYMGSSMMDEKLSVFLKNHFPESKGDLFAVFIEVTNRIVGKYGLTALITMQSWMFLSSYEKLRRKLIDYDMPFILHLGSRAFEEITGDVVQTVAFVFRKSHIASYNTICDRLINIGDALEKEKAFLTTNYRYICKKENFKKIPAKPYAYWISATVLESFENRNLGDFAEIVSGMTTGNNDLYVREWFEICICHIAFDKTSLNDIDLSKTMWIPYNKGGEQRRWYGNNEYVVNWSQSPNFNRAKTTMTHLYLKPCVTWSDISGKSFAGRFCKGGFMFDVKGSCAFTNEHDIYYLMAIFNSKITPIYIEALNPTTTTQVGDLKRIPLILPKHEIRNEIEKLVKENISISKDEWDSYELSWDFQKHPLLRFAASSGKISDAFMCWKEYIDHQKHKMQSNEMQINKLLISCYGLEKELTSDVDFNKICIRDANISREVKSLLSYAVGCFFGRYSLEKPGLIYAGGDWDIGRYCRMLPNADNIIPITDEEYFSDDIVGCLCNWLKSAFGVETLEKNLDFIAQSLNIPGKTSREIIRNYFIEEFFYDHCKIYQKRPIYWLFDSGKQNGFKALIYMHRYDENTIGNLRIDYLHHMERIYESEIARMQDIIDNSSDAREVTKATKRKEKLQKQVKECKEYDEKIAHLALARISIDLDDGVKVNYEKVQTVDGKKYQVLAKI